MPSTRLPSSSCEREHRPSLRARPFPVGRGVDDQRHGQREPMTPERLVDVRQVRAQVILELALRVDELLGWCVNASPSCWISDARKLM